MVLTVASILLVVGLIDPLEGGLALLGAIALLIVVRLLSRVVAIPKLAWIPVAIAAALGVTVMSLAVFATPAAPVDGAVADPLAGGALALLWVYRVAVLIAVAGAVQYLVGLARAVRAPNEPVAASGVP